MMTVYIPGVKFDEHMREDLRQRAQEALREMKAPRDQMLPMADFMMQGDEADAEEMGFEEWMARCHKPLVQTSLEDALEASQHPTKQEVIRESMHHGYFDNKNWDEFEHEGETFDNEQAKLIIQAYLEGGGILCPQWIRDSEEMFGCKRKLLGIDQIDPTSELFAWPIAPEWYCPVHHDSLTTRQSVALTYIEMELEWKSRQRKKACAGNSESEGENIYDRIDSDDADDVHTDLLFGIKRSHVHHDCAPCALPRSTCHTKPSAYKEFPGVCFQSLPSS